jgi:hypothetical protein
MNTERSRRQRQMRDIEAARIEREVGLKKYQEQQAALNRVTAALTRKTGPARPRDDLDLDTIVAQVFSNNLSTSMSGKSLYASLSSQALTAAAQRPPGVKQADLLDAFKRLMIYGTVALKPTP